MEPSIDLRVAELLASRLCHDLAGPIGAIGNGMELLSEPGLAMDDEAGALINGSVQQASRRLQFYRLAYGASGEQHLTLAEARKVTAELVEGEPLIVDWDCAAHPDLRGAEAKLLLNQIALALEALPRGGRLRVVAEPAVLIVESSSEGRPVDLRSDTWLALNTENPGKELTARNVHAYLLRRLADRLGRRLSIDATDGLLRIAAARPADDDHAR